MAYGHDPQAGGWAAPPPPPAPPGAWPGAAPGGWPPAPTGWDAGPTGWDAAPAGWGSAPEGPTGAPPPPGVPVPGFGGPPVPGAVPIPGPLGTGSAPVPGPPGAGTAPVPGPPGAGAPSVEGRARALQALAGLRSASFAVAGLGVVAVLAPLARWVAVDIDFAGDQLSASTTGFGQGTVNVPGAFGNVSQAWGQWTLGGIPDGVIVAVLGAALVARGVRTAFLTRRAAPTETSLVLGAGAQAVVATLGLLWLVLSWRHQRNALADEIDRVAPLLGPQADLFRDAVDVQVGIGLLLSAGAFALALVAGLIGTWNALAAASTVAPAPLGAEPPLAPAWAAPPMGAPAMGAPAMGGPPAPAPAPTPAPWSAPDEPPRAVPPAVAEALPPPDAL